MDLGHQQAFRTGLGGCVFFDEIAVGHNLFHLVVSYASDSHTLLGVDGEDVTVILALRSASRSMAGIYKSISPRRRQWPLSPFRVLAYWALGISAMLPPNPA